MLLSGCTIHEINHDPAPAIDMPPTFSVSNQTNTPDFNKPWWEHFQRPALTDLIESSLQNNQDIAAAMARVRQAEAIARTTRAERMPQIDIEGDYNKSWRGSSEQRANGDIGAALKWEVDIFNRIGSAAQSDSLEALARSEAVQALKLTLSAEIADAYFGAAAAHRTLSLLREQLKLDRDLLDLLQLRLDNGVGTSVDVLQQKSRVADSETLIPLAQSDLAVFENRLDVLIGKAPDGKRRVSEKETLAFSENMPPLGVPAILLLNRPDLRAARAELIAADADIAAAIADRLPSITLDASYVYADTLAYSGPVGAIMAAFVQPLLDWGKRKAEVERNKALYEERLAAFTQEFLEAVEDVENALVREQKQREYLKRLSNQKRILQQTVNASEDRYTQGIDDYTPVINALQELREVERDLISGRLDLIQIRIALFRAIGGPVQSMHTIPPASPLDFLEDDTTL